MNPVQPILTLHLFPGLSAELLRVLRALAPEAWDAPTPCAGWSVRDVAAHLLGGSLGRLSFGRDGQRPHPRFAHIKDYAGLLDAINAQNAEWVSAARRIPAGLLPDWLEAADAQLYEYFKCLPPFEPAGVAVAWAGDAQSPNWFDIAREYTEKWLHQQHIREAVGQPVLAERRWLFPVLDTFMRALPHTYRCLEAADGAVIAVHISGEAGGDWSLLREGGEWKLHTGLAPDRLALARLDQDTAWRLFTRGISPDAAAKHIAVEGNRSIGTQLLEMVSIMA